MLLYSAMFYSCTLVGNALNHSHLNVIVLLCADSWLPGNNHSHNLYPLGLCYFSSCVFMHDLNVLENLLEQLVKGITF